MITIQTIMSFARFVGIHTFGFLRKNIKAVEFEYVMRHREKERNNEFRGGASLAVEFRHSRRDDPPGE